MYYTGKMEVFGWRPVVFDSLHVCLVVERVGGIISFDERIVMNSCKY